MRAHSSWSLAVVTAAALAAVACGGGGGDGDPPADSPPQPEPLPANSMSIDGAVAPVVAAVQLLGHRQALCLRNAGQDAICFHLRQEGSHLVTGTWEALEEGGLSAITVTVGERTAEYGPLSSGTGVLTVSGTTEATLTVKASFTFPGTANQPERTVAVDYSGPYGTLTAPDTPQGTMMIDGTRSDIDMGVVLFWPGARAICVVNGAGHKICFEVTDDRDVNVDGNEFPVGTWSLGTRLYEISRFRQGVDPIGVDWHADSSASGSVTVLGGGATLTVLGSFVFDGGAHSIEVNYSGQYRYIADQ